MFQDDSRGNCEEDGGGKEQGQVEYVARSKNQRARVNREQNADNVEEIQQRFRGECPAHHRSEIGIFHILVAGL